MPYQVLLNHVLYMFHGLQLPAFRLYRSQYFPYQGFVGPVLLFHFIVRLVDCSNDFVLFIGHHTPIPFLNLLDHNPLLIHTLIISITVLSIINDRYIPYLVS